MHDATVLTAIFRQRLLDHLLSLRLQVGLVALVLLFVGNGVIYTWKYDRLRAAEPALQRSIEQRYERSTSVSAATGQTYQVVSDPFPALFIAEGGESWLGETFYVSPPREQTSLMPGASAAATTGCSATMPSTGP